METREYIVDVIGDGTVENPFRPSISGIPGIAWSWALSSDTITGYPRQSRTSVWVTAKNFESILAIPNVTAVL